MFGGHPPSPFCFVDILNGLSGRYRDRINAKAQFCVTSSRPDSNSVSMMASTKQPSSWAQIHVENRQAVISTGGKSDGQELKSLFQRKGDRDGGTYQTSTSEHARLDLDLDHHFVANIDATRLEEAKIS